MGDEYARIVANAKSDPGTAGDESEETWKQLFIKWLPPQYHIETKGRIIAADGTLSSQVDLVILSPGYPQRLREAKMWMADGVLAVFECKLTLTAKHVTEGVERAAEIKGLYTQRTGSPRKELRSPLMYGLLANSHSWKGDNSRPIENIEKALEEAELAINHPKSLIDLICVVDLATWVSSLIPYYKADGAESRIAKLEKIFMGKWGLASAMVRTGIDRNKPDGYSPIGHSIFTITNRLAWDDPSLRCMTEYFTRAGLQGAGSGFMRFWPQTIYSAETRAAIPAKLRNGELWSEWNQGGL